MAELSEMRVQGTEAQLKIALKDIPLSMLPEGIKGGDTRIIWNPANADEVEQARRTFDNLKAKGYAGFNVDKTGEQAGPMRSFDAEAGKFIMTLPLRGGIGVEHLPKQEARLENWFKCPYYDHYHGEVYGHPKLTDGHMIKTSQVVKENLDVGVIETINTFYKLGVEGVVPELLPEVPQ